MPRPGRRAARRLSDRDARLLRGDGHSDQARARRARLRHARRARAGRPGQRDARARAVARRRIRSAAASRSTTPSGVDDGRRRRRRHPSSRSRRRRRGPRSISRTRSARFRSWRSSSAPRAIRTPPCRRSAARSPSSIRRCRSANVQTMDEHLARALSRPKFVSTLVTAFGALAVTLALDRHLRR